MGFLANEYILVGEDGCKMSGQEKENSKELEGKVIEKVQDIETIGDLKRDKAAKKTYVTKARRCRDMNTEQKPLEYEFNHLVFGVNSSLFWHNLCLGIMQNYMRNSIQEQQKAC